MKIIHEIIYWLRHILDPLPIKLHIDEDIDRRLFRVLRYNQHLHNREHAAIAGLEIILQLHERVPEGHAIICRIHGGQIVIDTPEELIGTADLTNLVILQQRTTSKRHNR